MNKKHQQDIARKLKILNHAKNINNVSKTCRYFGICRETFYKWKRIFDKEGEHVLYCFGARKPGIPELEEWRSIVENIIETKQELKV